MTTSPIPQCRAVDRAVLVIAMALTTARVWRTHRAVKWGHGKGWERRLGRGMER